MTLLSGLLNLIYIALLTLLSPVIVFKMWTQGKYRQGWGEKLLGKLPHGSPRKQRLWFHAVSVGEVLQLRNVIAELRTIYPDWEFVITTTTHTGHKVACEQFPDCQVCYFPLDFTWAVKSAFRRIRPDAIVLVELELWPNFILTAKRQQVPLILINGRVSENSFKGYSRITWLMRKLLPAFEVITMQNETYSQRIIALGAPAENVHVTGSIKFDGVTTDRAASDVIALRESFGISTTDRVFIAGSTQSPEEEYALTVYQHLKQEFPKLRLILVPRHQERFEEVAQLVKGTGLPLLRRSQLKSGEALAANQPSSPVLLLDTLGELRACWGLSELAFVGGSLTRRGGQNMLEPAAYGSAVCFGRNTWNFQDITTELLERNAARVVNDAQQLEETLREWLTDPEVPRGLGQRARAFVLSQQGATEKTLTQICSILDQTDGSANSTQSFAA